MTSSHQRTRRNNVGRCVYGVEKRREGIAPFWRSKCSISLKYYIPHVRQERSYWLLPMCLRTWLSGVSLMGRLDDLKGQPKLFYNSKSYLPTAFRMSLGTLFPASSSLFRALLLCRQFNKARPPRSPILFQRKSVQKANFQHSSHTSAEKYRAQEKPCSLYLCMQC